MPTVAAPAAISVPNATVGKEYCANLAQSLDHGRTYELAIIETTTLESLGLEWTSTTGTLKGTPNRSGEFLIAIQDSRKDRATGPSLPERSFRLTINPDARSLWKDLPSDPAALYAKSDTDCAELCASERWLPPANVVDRTRMRQAPR
ncbi:MAG: hypothetical protein IPP62_17940 [bacterium]|nr:hypothetical protein [bacterium]